MRLRYYSLTNSRALALPALAVFALLAGCKTQQVPSVWALEPIVVDGKMTEWTDKPITYFEDQGAALGFGNDSENLYIHFRFTNPSWARAIRMTGLTLWIDTSGKKNKDVGLRFHGGPAMEELPAVSRERRSDGLTRQQKEQLLQRDAMSHNQLIFFDQSYYVEAGIPTDGSRGPAAGYDTSFGFYSFEFSVPLTGSGVQFYGLGAQPGQTISIGAEWGDMSSLRREGMGRDGMRGDMGGGRGGMGGGRGGMGGGQRPGGMKPPEKQEVWVKIELALPSEKRQE